MFTELFLAFLDRTLFVPKDCEVYNGVCGEFIVNLLEKPVFI